jgi:hypothetical protein
MNAGKKGFFCLFNNRFVQYAQGAVITFLQHHPDWEVEAFVVNTLPGRLSHGIWNDRRVHLNRINRNFLGFDKERMFCNSMRFVEYMDKAKRYEKIICTDVDCLFKEPLTEIIDQLDNNDICLYYDANATPKDRAGASFLAFRPNSLIFEFFRRYESKLKSRKPCWWNDQICMAETYEEMRDQLRAFIFPYRKYCFSALDDKGIEECKVIQPRGPKDSPALSKYRDLLQEVLSARKKMDVIVVGSGPSGWAIKDWDLSEHYVIAINHAWQLTPFWTHLIHPDDYYGPFPESLNQIQQIVGSEKYLKDNLKFGNQEWRGNCMLYNALYYALHFHPNTIGTIGADLYYPADGPTHFYGNGTPDPMRFTAPVHQEWFRRFVVCSQQRRVSRLVNWSEEERGLNPFSHAKFPRPKKSA